MSTPPNGIQPGNHEDDPQSVGQQHPSANPWMNDGGAEPGRAARDPRENQFRPPAFGDPLGGGAEQFPQQLGHSAPQPQQQGEFPPPGQYPQGPFPRSLNASSPAGHRSPNPSISQASPALQELKPTTSGPQILAWLLDSIFSGVVFGGVIFACFLPVIISGLSLVSGNGQYESTDDYFNSPGVEAGFETAALISYSLASLVGLVYYALYAYLVGVKGRTPGMAIMGLRLVSVKTGRPIGFWRAVLRGVVIVIGGNITLGILSLLFWLSPLFDKVSGWAQGWHDQLIKAVYIDTKNGPDVTPSPVRQSVRRY